MNEFDQQAKDWDNDPVRVLRARAVADAIRNHVPLASRMNAMEYGCGTGLLSFELRGDIGPITLADSSEGMLEVLRDKIAACGAVNMTPMKLDLAVDPLGRALRLRVERMPSAGKAHLQALTTDPRGGLVRVTIPCRLHLAWWS